MIGIIRHETSYTTEGKDEPNTFHADIVTDIILPKLHAVF